MAGALWVMTGIGFDIGMGLFMSVQASNLKQLHKKIMKKYSLHLFW